MLKDKMRYLLPLAFSDMERISRLLTGQDERCGSRSEVRDSHSSTELDVIEAARGLMLATLSTGKSIEAVAASVRMSKRHFLRVFKRATGTTPHSWRLVEKVRSSQQDLLKGDLSLSEIAHAYGFADQAHYSRVFKRVVGTSPGVWRNWAQPMVERRPTVRKLG
ncbi:helix-turn-helix transcriptional regulator [Paraburkholderia azotifigens]|uniref:helix-turn-helix transcriptional regulator n=1 Tax=Paraburkholderia azotifigens TaxID=2057004 RepID=UPI00317C29EB